ncbi:glutathione S-transferase 4-like [Limulus polyphemus]|uniref:Glutathione S-transferase 4-like n=1 Tax=Limulus polyphemus TaxID=6850 RepID=A0ABM1BMR3_LIMPO|nr:glutathione S-transferase 4-like [Limulus polyphemus]
MPYKIIDYDFTTEADLARLILDYKGIEYESVRLSKENAAEAEATAPFGKLPILEEDGEVTVGGPALPSYLAMKHDFAGSDIKQKGKCATIIVGLREMFVKFRQEDMMKLTQEEKVCLFCLIIK